MKMKATNTSLDGPITDGLGADFALSGGNDLSFKITNWCKILQFLCHNNER